MMDLTGGAVCISYRLGFNLPHCPDHAQAPHVSVHTMMTSRFRADSQSSHIGNWTSALCGLTLLAVHVLANTCPLRFKCVLVHLSGWKTDQDRTQWRTVTCQGILRRRPSEAALTSPEKEVMSSTLQQPAHRTCWRSGRTWAVPRPVELGSQ